MTFQYGRITPVPFIRLDTIACFMVRVTVELEPIQGTEHSHTHSYLGAISCGL